MTASDHDDNREEPTGGERRPGESVTRQRIIDAAVACILDTGFYRASSNEIARRAGVTWGAIQRQFGTREALMLAAFEGEWQRLLNTMGSHIEGDSTQVRVRSLFTLLKSHYSRPEYFAAVQIITNLRQDPKTTQATLDVIEQMSRKTAGMLPKLLRQLLPGADFDSAVTNTLFFTIRDFFIGLHVEAATTLAETYQHRLDRLDAEEAILIRNLVMLVEGEFGARDSTEPASDRSGRIHQQPHPRRDGVSAADVGRPLLEFAVAKVSPNPAGGLRISYLCDAGEVHRATATGIDSPLTPGSHTLTVAENGRTDSVALSVQRRGGVFDLAAVVDGLTVRGVGLADPEHPDSLLIGWSWGAETLTGIAKYVIADEPHTITCAYTSAVPSALGFGDVKGGRASGFTTDGFPGVYSIVYDGDDMANGPFTWTIVERGNAYELMWDTGARRAMEGFGFPDPDSDRAIIVVYWATGPRRQLPAGAAG